MKFPQNDKKLTEFLWNFPHNLPIFRADFDGSSSAFLHFWDGPECLPDTVHHKAIGVHKIPARFWNKIKD